MVAVLFANARLLYRTLEHIGLRVWSRHERHGTMMWSAVIDFSNHNLSDRINFLTLLAKGAHASRVIRGWRL